MHEGRNKKFQTEGENFNLKKRKGKTVEVTQKVEDLYIFKANIIFGNEKGNQNYLEVGGGLLLRNFIVGILWKYYFSLKFQIFQH